MKLVNIINDLQKDGQRLDDKSGSVSPSTVRNCYKAIKSVFNVAVDWRLIKENPAEGIKLPKIKRPQMEVYNVIEQLRVYEALQNEDMSWKILVLIALVAGPRAGEIAGVEWKHVDFETSQITFTQTIFEKVGKGVQIKDTTKTGVTKTVSLPFWLMAILEDYKANEWKDIHAVALHEKNTWRDHEFLFCNLEGKPICPDSISQRWRRFIEKINKNIKGDEEPLKFIRFHDLRHTSAIHLLTQGESVKVVQARLGHKKYHTTMDIYSHILKEVDQAAADKFEDPFSSRQSRFSPKSQNKDN
ncbi:tyrosine-type recombinase/integrase [Listeria goaensis]|uniref:tyrosine-type recombinase/integrase n=1 Tax=Listeria goaensis TaxID=1649188 RepID=UPI000B58DD05|nr:site-specific integrase [Listeria goaensis]